MRSNGKAARSRYKRDQSKRKGTCPCAWLRCRLSGPFWLIVSPGSSSTWVSHYVRCICLTAGLSVILFSIGPDAGSSLDCSGSGSSMCAIARPMVRWGQITHLALQALVVSILTTGGKLLRMRSYNRPLARQTIADRRFTAFVPFSLVEIREPTSYATEGVGSEKELHYQCRSHGIGVTLPPRRIPFPITLLAKSTVQLQPL